jgi:23S rRNA pseudouridine955/2504/2580 synthase
MKATAVPSRREGVKYIVIGAQDVGQRIDNFLVRALKDVPKSHVYKILRRGEVRINKGRVKPTYRVGMGDRVRIPPLSYQPSQGTAQRAPDALLNRLESAVILEDGDFVFLDKPSGLAVHGGSGVDYGIIDLLRQSRPNAAMLELGHRLDKETSGCLLIAKSRPALTGLHRLLREGSVEKRYLALTAGAWKGGGICVDAPLATHQRVNASKGKMGVASEGKKAESVFKPLKRFSDSTLVQVQIRTGRTHQVRVHAAHIGHPLAGDFKYGDYGFNRRMQEIGLKRLFLHASCVVFQNPRTGTNYRVEAPLEPSLERLLSRLKHI